LSKKLFSCTKGSATCKLLFDWSRLRQMRFYICRTTTLWCDCLKDLNYVSFCPLCHKVYPRSHI
jgi:hypothetical protein